MRHLHILLLAAGASSRMGQRDKLLEPVGPEPLIVRLCRLGLATGLPMTVVLRPDRPLRLAAIDGLPVHRVIARNADLGMAESLKAGIAAIPADSDILLLLGDLPELDGEDLSSMAAAWQTYPGSLLRATDDMGIPGHPVVFPSELRPALLQLSGDQGAREILKAHSDHIVPVKLGGKHATTDLDTPEEWEKWRAARR